MPRQCITTEEQTPDDGDANEVSLFAGICPTLHTSPRSWRRCRSFWSRLSEFLIKNHAISALYKCRSKRPSTSFITSRRPRSPAHFFLPSKLPPTIRKRRVKKFERAPKESIKRSVCLSVKSNLKALLHSLLLLVPFSSFIPMCKTTATALCLTRHFSPSTFLNTRKEFELRPTEKLHTYVG